MARTVLLLSLLACLPCEAILIRPDRDDAEYLELATRYPASMRIDATGGEGVLIAPRWLLTSARMARKLEGSRLWAPIAHGGRQYAIQSSFAHPEWKGGADSDIALILLREAVHDVEPARIHRDPRQQGKAVIVVGHGETGMLGARPSKDDRRKRAAINTIDRSVSRIFTLAIKPPDQASDLQGAAAPGDGGGPAFIEVDEGIVVAGIFSMTEDANANGLEGDIGDRQVYVRVADYADWIDATMFRAATDEAARSTQPAIKR